MTLNDIDAFIDHWHAAAREGGNAEESEELEELALTLKRIVRSASSIQSLATSPLLLAMLCALNRDRHSQIPRDRMELYRIALEMLVDRRDVERKIPTGGMSLRLAEKFALLEELAFWLLLNQQSDILIDAAVSRVEAKLESMPQITESPDAVFEYLLLRSGVLREPVEGRVDFVHRTFQEYLGAHEAVERNDIGLLIYRAHLDQWREVVVLAAGHASPAQRPELISGLLDRGDAESRFTHRLHLLAVACLETSVDLEPAVRVRVQGSLEQLVPPRNMSEARALSSARELAVPLLAGKGRAYATEVAASVRALSYIGGDAALDALGQIAAWEANRVTVSRELIRAWPTFDIEQYAQRVLANSCLEYGRLLLRDPEFLRGVRHLSQLDRLECVFTDRDVKLALLSELEALRFLSMSRCYGFESFAELQDVPNLQALHITASGLSDLATLAHLSSVQNLGVSGSPGVADFAPLLALTQLQSLVVRGPSPVRDITNIGLLTHLTALNLHDLDELQSFDGISQLSELRLFRAPYAREVRDISELALLPKLEVLELYRSGGSCPTEPLSALDTLSRLGLEQCGIDDLSFLGPLKQLAHLDLSGNENIVDVEPLRELPALRWLDLRGTSASDFSPLFALSGANLYLPYASRASRLPDEFTRKNQVRWTRYWAE